MRPSAVASQLAAAWSRYGPDHGRTAERRTAHLFAIAAVATMEYEKRSGAENEHKQDGTRNPRGQTPKEEAS